MLIPQSPEAAVLIGAAHFCYDPSDIWSRRAKFTYGCDVRMPFDEVRDAGRPRVIDEDGKPRCDRFSIFVSAGQEVRVGSSAPPQTFVPSTSAQKEVPFVFYASRDQDPRYVDDPGVQAIGQVTVKLAGAMHLPREQRKLAVRMKFGETQIEVDAVNVHTGKSEQTQLEFNSTYLRM